jgi:hypothetical protein
VNIARTVVLARVTLAMALLGAAAITLQEYRQRSAVEQRAATEREEKQQKACALLTRALSVVEGRQRYDLSAEKDGALPCDRPANEGCPYVVELDWELLQAGRGDLVATLTEALDSSYCDADLYFAAKHGLPAYRDHRDRVAEIVDQFFRTYGPAISRMVKQ